MNLFLIAWRNIQQRGLASVLTTLSMALGVLLVVTVLAIHGVVAQSFKNNSALGYNLIVGAKGGKLQLTLNTVYYLSQPVENIPYEYYLEFKDDEVRRADLQNSIRAHLSDLAWETNAATFQLNAAEGDLGGLLGAAVSDACQAADREALDLDRGGRFGQFTALAIPLCLGDYFGQFRVVGTTPELFNDLTFGPALDRKYEFADGRNFQTWTEENGYFEAVVGSTVARRMNVDVGDDISPAHGGAEGDEHDQTFKVVGILRPSGTPNDRAVFINMEGFFLMDDHAKPLTSDEAPAGSGLAALFGGATPEAEGDATPSGERVEPLPLEQREVTAILVRTGNPLFAVGLPNTINEGSVAQCVMPIREISNLFDFIVRPIQSALLAITALVCLVSGISILVSIYNSMNDRKRDIAVMRALGAGRGTVMTVILLESILLAAAGGFLGWFGGHALMASPPVRAAVEERTGVSIGFLSHAPPLEGLENEKLERIIGWLPPELFLVPALVLLAIVVGFLPAMAAYRTDVAKSLSS